MNKLEQEKKYYIVMVINYYGLRQENNTQIYFNNKKVKYFNIKKNKILIFNKIYFS